MSGIIRGSPRRPRGLLSAVRESVFSLGYGGAEAALLLRGLTSADLNEDLARQTRFADVPESAVSTGGSGDRSG